VAGIELRVYQFFHRNIYITVIALLFTGLGIWLALKLVRPKIQTVVIETPAPATSEFRINEKLLKELRISTRELEVLQLMSQGFSNQQIADSIFVSVSTVKTHANNLFLKMEVERRTQAIEKAKRLSLIP
jgi:ATP/maltotriose-dependent transcriptional regulator MalT